MKQLGLIRGYTKLSAFIQTDLVRVENLQKGFIDVRLALEAVLDLVHIVDSVVELHGLVVLQRRASGGPTEGRVGLYGWRAWGGVHGDGRIGLAAWCQRLRRLKQKKCFFKM